MRETPRDGCLDESPGLATEQKSTAVYSNLTAVEIPKVQKKFYPSRHMPPGTRTEWACDLIRPAAFLRHLFHRQPC